MNKVSGNCGFLNTVKCRFLSVALAANALTLGSSGCSPTQDAIRVSHAPIDKFDLHPALEKYLNNLGNSEAREKTLDEIFAGNLKLPKFYTITNKGFYGLFNIKDDDDLILDQDHRVAISLAAAHIQDELEQLEKHSQLSQEETNWKFYNLVNSNAMKVFCKAWDLQTSNPENPLVARAIRYFETHFGSFPSTAKLDRDSVMGKVYKPRESGMRLDVLKFYTNEAFGIEKILAKPKLEEEPVLEKIQPQKPEQRKADPKLERFDPSFPIPLACDEVTKVA